MKKNVYTILIFTVFLVLSSPLSNISHVKAQNTDTSIWTLVETIINPLNIPSESHSSDPFSMGSYSKTRISETSMSLSSHSVIEGVWGFDNSFEFGWDKPPQTLIPGETIILKTTGTASWNLNQTAYFNEFWFMVGVPVRGTYTAMDYRGLSEVSPREDWDNTGPPTRETTVLSSTMEKTTSVRIPEIHNLQTITETFTITVDLDRNPVQWVYQPSSQPPQPQRNPSFNVNPVEGYSGDEVSCEGTEFPSNEEVEIHWDSPNGPIIGRVQTDSNGNFKVNVFIPVDQDPGDYTIYAVSVNTLLSSPFKVLEELCISGYVHIKFLEGLPLRDVPVLLWRIDLVAGGPNVLVGTSITDENGYYRICSDQIMFPSGLFYIDVQLIERRSRTADFGIKIIDQEYHWTDRFTNPPPYVITFGEDGKQGVNSISDAFEITDEFDLDRDLWVNYVDDNQDTENREDHAFNAAIIYYHTHQAMRFYRDVLNVNIARDTPVYVHQAEEGAWHIFDEGIFMGEVASLWNNGHAPKNREYHEYSHWVMGQTYGQMPPLWAENIDFNGNGLIDADTNHGDYSSLYPTGASSYNELSSSDAWTEGFAEFMALVIADYYRNIVFEPFWQDILPNYIYTIGHPFPYLVNLELNYYAAFDEEYTLASILWDIYDPISGFDKISLSITKLWDLISQRHVLPIYYNSTENYIQDFLGDGYTYSTIPEIRERQEESQYTWYPTETRYIYYVRDLYDVLVEAAGTDPSLTIEDIDETFRAHKEFLNSFYNYDDYSIPPHLDGNIITVADTGSTINLETSTPPAQSWWSNGFEVKIDNNGWGSGVMVEKEFDATGWLYAWIWVDAPEGVEMSVVVEDYAGEWISEFTSNGQGFNQPHVVILGPKNLFLGQNGFIPNPYSNTPEEIDGPRIYFQNQIPIKKMGLLFHSPGSYIVDIGPMLLTRGYPWKPGVYQIMGIGDPGASSFRPYRRNKPSIEGALIQVSLDEVPAVLTIEKKYAPPYQDLDFTHTVILTEKTSSVGLYVDPSLDGVDNEVILSIQMEGFFSSEPVSITSSTYWDNIGTDEHIMELVFDLEPYESSGISVNTHVISKGMDDSGIPLDISSSFLTDESVFSRLSIDNAKQGDQIVWLIYGPNSIEEESEYILNWSGEGYVYTWLELDEYDPKQVIGQWEVIVYVNGDEVSSEYFAVEAETSQIPGLPLEALIIGIILTSLILHVGARARARLVFI